MGWFEKVHYGVEAQKRLQLGFGVSCFLVLVAVPTWFEYWMGHSKKRYERKLLAPTYESPESNAFRAKLKGRLLEAKFNPTIVTIEKL